jgi:RNA polymerase sigma-70 factor (ECF subfamily)
MNKTAWMDAAEEKSLIERSISGDREAFGVIVKEYAHRAYITALVLLGDPDDAMDASQEAFARALRQIKRFDTNHRFFPWFHKLLRNLCLNLLRSRNRRMCHTAPLDDMISVLPDKSPDARQQLAHKETREQLWRAIEELSPEHKEIVTLKYFHELSYKEIAETLDIPIGTVMSRLYHARMGLKRLLSADENKSIAS